MKRIPQMLLFFFLTWTTLQAQETLIPRALLFQEKEKFNVQLAPNGQQVFYQKSGAPTSIFYVKMPGIQQERSIQFDAPVVNWVSTYSDGILAILKKGDAQTLAYWSDRTGKAREISLLEGGMYRIMGQSSRLQTKVAIWGRSTVNNQSGIYLVDVEGRSVTKKIMEEEGFEEVYFDAIFSPVAAWKRNAQGGNSIFLMEEGVWKPKVEFPYDESQFIGGFQQVIGVRADGQMLYYTDNTNSDKTVLKELNLQDGSEKVVATDEKVDLLPMGKVLRSDGTPVMVLGIYGEGKRHFLDASMQTHYENLQKQLEGEASLAAVSANDSTWLVRSVDGGPMDYFMYHIGSNQLRPLFSDFEALDAYELADRRTYTVTTRDGLEFPVQVYLPPNADGDADGIPNRALPAVMYVHGGPWVGGIHWNNWFHTRNFQLLANRGYAVINVEFRSTTGLGKKILNAGDKEWGGKMHFDLVDIADWAIDQGIADPDAFGIWGWSYGGYAANAALVYSPDMFQAGVSMYGPSDLEAMFEMDQIKNSNVWLNRVGNYADPMELKLLQQHSPINFVDRMESPILLTTGSKDERVPKETQVDRFAAAVAEAGKEVVYFYYPEEGHDYRAPESWISFWAITEQFLATHLGGNYEAAGADLQNAGFKVEYGKSFIDNLK